MTGTVLIGRGATISNIPRSDWEHELSSAPEHISRRLEFMSHDHHLVRNFVVRELPRLGRPISPAEISHALDLSRTRTTSIVEDLEKNLFFLVRGNGAEVSWAFPVTAEETGHHLVFSTGERLDAA
jgi:hypothetical protein